MRPELMGGVVDLHYANLPRPGKFSPYLVGDVSPDSAPAVTANDEELRHIPDGFICRDSGTFSYQNHTSQFVVDAHEKRKPIGLAPIEGKVGIAEPAVFAQFDVVKFAEVMRVELKQIDHDGLLLPCGGNDCDSSRRDLCLHAPSLKITALLRRATFRRCREVSYCGRPPPLPTKTRTVTLPMFCEPAAAVQVSCSQCDLAEGGAATWALIG